MLQNLESLVREQSQDVIINNPDVPEEKNSAAIQAASSSVFETLKQKASSGDLSGLADVFNQGNNPESSVVKDASSNYANKLQGLGINMESAKSIAATLIPAVIAHFTNKTNDPNDKSFDLQDIISSISGPDGKFQFSDLSNLLKSDGRQEGGGNIVDKLKGLF